MHVYVPRIVVHILKSSYLRSANYLNKLDADRWLTSKDETLMVQVYTLDIDGDQWVEVTRWDKLKPPSQRFIVHVDRSDGTAGRTFVGTRKQAQTAARRHVEGHYSDQD